MGWFSRNGHKLPTLVLSGGGSMGALQAGILVVLMRQGFRPGRIVGTSVGALNGAFLAFHPDSQGAEELVDIWRGLEKERYLRINPVSIAYRLASRQTHLFNNRFLLDLIARHAETDDFSATTVPFSVTATNLYTGRKEVFSTGPISQAILASTAIPGIFEPHQINGQAYIDGGVVSNLDLETAIDDGAKEILAIDLSHCFELPSPKNVAGVIVRTVDIVMRERVQHDMLALARKAKIALVQPEVEHGPGVGDFRNVVRLLQEGVSIGHRLLERCFDDKGRLRPGVYRESAGDIPVVESKPVQPHAPWGFSHGTTQQEV
jgi:NTE family protein